MSNSYKLAELIQYLQFVHSTLKLLALLLFFWLSVQIHSEVFFNGIFIHFFIKSFTKISSYFFIIKHIKVQEFPHQIDKRNMNDLLSFDHAKREWAVTKIYGNYKNDWFQSALWRKSQKNDSKNIFMLG